MVSCRPRWNAIYCANVFIRSCPIPLDSKVKALAIARAAQDKKAVDVVALHVQTLTSLADYFVLCSGESERQVRAIADAVDGTLSRQGSPPLRIEGGTSSKWIVMDFGDVLVHIFHQDVREHYGLEKLWADAKRVRIPAETKPVSTAKPARTAKPRTAKPRASRISR